MLLYSVSENGALRKATKVDFAENKVYLIDDFKTIYIWFGQKASKKKKDLSVKKANNLNKKRNSTANIQIINQNQEFGAFLAIKDVLKKGLKQNIPIKRRQELKLEIEDTLELIETGLEPDLEAELTVAAYNIAQEKKSYRELCRNLAELQLTLMKGKGKTSEKEIKRKEDEIFLSSSTYDELCWLIAELKILLERKSFNKKKN
jgi:bifunctional DNA-binding transcriptional regulator/antitoxin component of YhaV-PrlF toxin-antitoxin module